jgi:hypothetical protein
MFHVSGSESTRGRAPALTTDAAHEIMVKAGMMTSLPLPISRAEIVTSRAAEPLETAMPYLRPTRSENRSSNRLINGPSEEIQPVSRHSFKYFFSFPASNGSLTGTGFAMLSFIVDLNLPAAELRLSLSPAKGPCFTSNVPTSSMTRSHGRS